MGSDSMGPAWGVDEGGSLEGRGWRLLLSKHGLGLALLGTAMTRHTWGISLDQGQGHDNCYVLHATYERSSRRIVFKYLLCVLGYTQTAVVALIATLNWIH